MPIAKLGTFLIGEYSEAVVTMSFYQVGELLQDVAIEKSKIYITSLMNIRLDYADLQGDSKLKKIDLNDVCSGNIIVVKTGKKAPIDGIIIEERSSLNITALTDESLPRDVIIGDEVSCTLSGRLILHSA